jgi:hypothetical protein
MEGALHDSDSFPRLIYVYNKVLEAFDRHSSSEKEKEELLAKAAERQGQGNETVGVVEAFRDPENRGRTLLAVFVSLLVLTTFKEYNVVSR